MIKVTAPQINHSLVNFKSFDFPVGEKHVVVEPTKATTVNILFKFENNEEIITLLLLCDALKRQGMQVDKLEIPYVPFSRQDRINIPGECFSLAVFANLINSLEFNEVIVYDPHSDVTPALLKNCKVITQADIFAPVLKDKKDYWLVSPDSGALKKTYNLANKVECLGVVHCTKHRDCKTGELIDISVNAGDFQNKDCWIIDDICDGGRTFIEIAELLKKLNCGKIYLGVTHGFFTKGLGVFKGLIEEIYTHTEGEVNVTCIV